MKTRENCQKPESLCLITSRKTQRKFRVAVKSTRYILELVTQMLAEALVNIWTKLRKSNQAILLIVILISNCVLNIVPMSVMVLLILFLVGVKFFLRQMGMEIKLVPLLLAAPLTAYLAGILGVIISGVIAAFIMAFFIRFPQSKISSNQNAF